MSEKARQYKPSTIRKLDLLSGNQCANPSCSNKLIARDGETLISKICHIEAVSNNGPRFNSKMDDDERRGFDNLILLCDECHSIIDNIANVPKYPVKLLKEWKKLHESKQISQHLNNPGLLNQAVIALSDLKLDNPTISHNVPKSFKITDKIAYNCIKQHKSLIEDYKIYYTKINAYILN